MNQKGIQHTGSSNSDRIANAAGTDTTPIGFVNLYKMGVMFTDNANLSLYDFPADHSLDCLNQAIVDQVTTANALRSIRECTDRAASLPNATQGNYANIPIPQVLAEVREQDLQAFLDYVSAYPGNYIDRNFKISETFATWVIYGAPGPVDDLSLIADLKQDIDAGKGSAYLHYCLGNVLFRTDSVDEAASHYQEALRLDSNCDDAYVGLGYIMVHEHRFEAAVEHCKNAIRINPHSAYAYYVMGCALRNVGRYYESLIALGKAVSIRPRMDTPNLADAYLLIAMIHAHSGKRRRTYTALRKAISYDPEVRLRMKGFREFDWVQLF